MPRRKLEDLPKWQRTAPYVRRFVLITGWLVYIAIPLLILRSSYSANAAFAAIYGSLGTTMGVAIGFYFYRRGEQDNTVVGAAIDASNEKVCEDVADRGDTK